MTIAVRCSDCGRELRLRSDLAGRRVRCPDCGSVISVSRPGQPAQPAVRHRSPRHAAAEPRAVPSTLQQLRDHPLRTMVRGVDAGEYQPAQRSAADRRRHKAVLLIMAAGWFGLALTAGLIAAIRFGLAVGALFAALPLAFSVVPMAFGMLFVGGSLLDWPLLFTSKQGRGVRKMFGDRGARSFYLIAGGALLLISYGTTFFFLLGAVFGDD